MMNDGRNSRRRREKFTIVRMLALLVASVSFGSLVSAGPAFHDVLDSDEPELVEVREVGLAFVEPGKADQAEAERLYLQFIKNNPDHELVPYVYNLLANLYGQRVTPAHRAAGAVKDRQKARSYWAKGVESYPENKIGYYLITQRLQLAATADTVTEKVVQYADYIDYVRDIASSDAQDIAGRLFLSERQKKAAAVRPGFRLSMARSLMKACQHYKGVSVANMCDLAFDRADPRWPLLLYILLRFRGREPEAEAQRWFLKWMNAEAMSVLDTMPLDSAELE